MVFELERKNAAGLRWCLQNPDGNEDWVKDVFPSSSAKSEIAASLLT
jgi:hypothetical protein